MTRGFSFLWWDERFAGIGGDMLFRGSLSFAGVAALVASSLAACSSTDAAPSLTPESGACEAYVPPSTFDATSPAVPFSQGATADSPTVMKVILQSCAFSSCHGSIAGPTGGMYLGPDLSMTYLNIVGVASNDEPSMVRVKASDPADSFLQHKIDGDSCTLSGCTSDDCTELMPYGQDLLAVNDRLTFRAWIAQGAQADFTIVSPDAGADVSDAGADAGDAGGD
jgi:hypothetical protein